MKLLSIRKVSKDFNGSSILKDVNLEVDRGSIIAIMGPSGCGKTTLLRIIGMLEDFTGEIRLKDYHYSNNHGKNDLEQRRNISIVFQKPVALNTTVYNNIAYGLQVRGAEKETIRAAVTWMLSALKIPPSMASRNPLRFSGGEIQRIALARAVIIEPELLLLDEPTANLDEQNTKEFERLLKSLNKEKQMTIIFSTHNKAQALRLTPTTYTLIKGRLVRL